MEFSIIIGFLLFTIWSFEIKNDPNYLKYKSAKWINYFLALIVFFVSIDSSLLYLNLFFSGTSEYLEPIKYTSLGFHALVRIVAMILYVVLALSIAVCSVFLTYRRHKARIIFIKLLPFQWFMLSFLMFMESIVRGDMFDARFAILTIVMLSAAFIPILVVYHLEYLKRIFH